MIARTGQAWLGVSMGRVAIIGGGLIGTCAAMMLARDGNDVTVLERDPAPPPPPDVAWEQWERRGVNQFRMIHYLLPRFRTVADAELPGLTAALLDAGALSWNILDAIPAEMTGGLRPEDDRFVSVTARRPVIESVVERLAAGTDGLTVRRGTSVEGLIAGDGADGIPHVSGVRLTGGEELTADLVVDAGGRRSAAPEWLRAIGSPGPDETIEDSGFQYYARHFRSGDGSIPAVISGLLEAYGSVSILTLPCDNGTWGVGLITSARDRALHRLSDKEVWDTTVRAFPLAAHWLDAEPITDIQIMAKIEDRHRSYVVDGKPVVSGLVPLGDAWACTNPSLGRGISIGIMHAAALRELVRDGPDDSRAQAERWAALTDERVEPYFADTLAFDRHRLAEIDCIVDGRRYETEDPGWGLGDALASSAGKDPELLRGFLDIVGLNARGLDVLSRPGVAERAIALADPAPPPGPDRAELLALVGA
jgi:2-polyprenyl-6-methoxyphenol hydroxylase-like FAD-dependent oxidoreductase